MSICSDVNQDESIPETILAAANTSVAFVKSPRTAGTVRRYSKVFGHLLEIGCFESHSAGFTGVRTIGGLEESRGTSQTLGAIHAWGGSKPLCVKGQPEIQLAWVKTQRNVLFDCIERLLNRSVVLGNVVATVHKVVCHDLEGC